MDQSGANNPITNIRNDSLMEGSIPYCLKIAYELTPLLRKPSMDKNVLKNYWPVSYLSFVSKLIEKVMAKQLNDFISQAEISNVHQPPYNRSLCLKYWFGADGAVLTRINSYLTSCTQKIKLGDRFSEAFHIPFGIPKGLVLGFLLFTLYTSPLSQVIPCFKVTNYVYADDTQIYLATEAKKFESSITELTVSFFC